MKIYSHNYTLPAEAEKKVHEAYMKCQDPEIKQLLEDAQETLRQYLAQDNMDEDPDCDGWCKSWQCFDDEQVEFIRDLFGDQLSKNLKSTSAEEELDIINKCQVRLNCPTYENVEQYGKDTSNNWGR